MEKKRTTLGLDLELMKGFDYDNYDPARLPKLPPEEDRLWYSKFYYRGRGEVAPELRAAVAPGNTMDPAKALLPGNLDALLAPGHVEGDLGYCLLPSGAGYGSIYCALPEVTLDMYKWYKQLRMVDKLSYKIWYPGSHLSEINGVTIEDVGFGPETFHVEPGLDWKALGFSANPRERDPQFAGLIGGNSWVENVDPAVERRAMLLFHYIRTLPTGGIEFRTHLYTGLFARNGGWEIVQDLDPAVCLEATRRMAAHCVYERANINNFLPELYEKMKDQPLAEPEFADQGLALKE